MKWHLVRIGSNERLSVVGHLHRAGEARVSGESVHEVASVQVPHFDVRIQTARDDELARRRVRRVAAAGVERVRGAGCRRGRGRGEERLRRRPHEHTVDAVGVALQLVHRRARLRVPDADREVIRAGHDDAPVVLYTAHRRHVPSEQVHTQAGPYVPQLHCGVARPASHPLKAQKRKFTCIYV